VHPPGTARCDQGCKSGHAIAPWPHGARAPCRCQPCACMQLCCPCGARPPQTVNGQRMRQAHPAAARRAAACPERTQRPALRAARTRPKPYHVCSAPAGAREGDDGQRAQRLHAQLLPAQRAREEHAPADALWRAAVLRDVVGPREEADACACIRGFLASRQPRPDDRRGLPSQTRAHATSTRTSDGAERLRQIRSKASVCWPPWRCISSMCKSPGQRASLS